MIDQSNSIDEMRDWLMDDEISHLSQDEDLFISFNRTSILLQTIEMGQGKPKKLAVLYQALTVKLFDDEFLDDEDRLKCIAWLKKNRSFWEPCSMDYIKDDIEQKLRNV